MLCLKQSYLKPGNAPQTLEYRDILSKWLGNVPGQNEIREHLRKARSNSLPIYLAIAHPITASEEKLVGNVADESHIKKTVSAKKDVVRTLEQFDDDTLLIVFRKVA